MASDHPPRPASAPGSPAAEFGRWLNDRERHLASRVAADELATLWAEGPAHRSLSATFARVHGQPADQVVAATRRLFAQERWVESLVADIAAAMRRDPFFEPPFRHINSDIHSGLIVFEDESVSIAVGVTDLCRLAAKKTQPRAGASIAFSGQIDVIKFVRSGGARLAFWEAPRIDGSFSAATAGRCRHTATRPIEDGELIVVDGRCESFVIEHAEANLMLLQATIKTDQAPLSVEYDSRTHEYVGCSAAEDSASRIQMITTLLRKLGCAKAFPVVAGFLHSSSFFVRWHVMKEMLGLDAAAALPHLERMASADPHPENRRAAATVLERLAVAHPGLRKAA